MDESGYCDAMSQHSNTANDDPTITVTVEPVDILVEKDGSILLSNLQSALPGAHGLYYYQFGHKKAVKYDSQSAKITPPSDGWGARSYFVTLAHGCKTSWTAFGSYENASKQFERSVRLVQKMLGVGDSIEVEKRQAATTKSEFGRCARCRAVVIIPDVDQDEDKTQHRERESSSQGMFFRLETTIDELSKALAAKEHEVQLLKEENHELRSQSNTVSDSDRSVVKENARPSSTDFSGQVDEGAEWYYDVSRKENELQARIDGLLQQLDDAQLRFNKLEQSSTEERQKLEGETAELRQQWNDAKWRIGELEAFLSSSNADVSHKNERIAQLELELGSVSNQLREAHQHNSQLEQELSLKRSEIDQITEKGDSLLQMSESIAANNSELVERVSQLETELAELRGALQESPVEVEYNRSQESSVNEDQARVEDLKQQLAELRDSYNQLEQESTLGRQKMEWEFGEVNQWLNDARWRIGELEEELQRKSSALDEKECAVDRLNDQLQDATRDLDDYRRQLSDLEHEYSDMKNKKEYMEQELAAAKKHLATTAQTPSHGRSDAQGEMLELSDELMKANLRKYELENHAAQLASDLRAARQRADHLEAIQQENAKNLWHSGERLSEFEREQHRLLHELGEANRVIDQLRHDLSQQDNRIAQDHPDVHHLREELRAARESLSVLAATEMDARQKVEWRLGEVTQAWNDAKWKLGEMEAGATHKQWELDQARHRIHELEQLLEKLQNFKSKATKVLEGSFLIRKQPYVDRAKWSLSMWDENTPAEGDSAYRRVWFDIDAPNARNVYLMGSFVNWECGMMCTATEGNENRKGVWVDLPPGRYEFRFLVDGDWRTAGDFPTCPNDFGSENNWRVVD